MFTFYPGFWKHRRQFFEQVRDALKAVPRLRVVFAMREDHVAAMDQFAALMPEKMRIRFRLERLRREEALLAVTGPLAGTGRAFAEGVAEQLVDDLLKIRVRAHSSEADGSKTGELVISEIDADGEVWGEFRSAGRRK